MKKRPAKRESEHVHCERHAELELIIEHSPDAIVTVDEAGVVVQWNKAARDLFGYSVEEAVGQAVSGLIVPQQMRAPHEDGLAGLRAGRPLRLTAPLALKAMRKDGSTLPVELRLSEFPTGKGRRLTAIIRDRREESKLLESFEQNRAILGGILARVPAAVWQTDRELRFTRLFGSALAKIGLDADSTPGTTLYDLFERKDEGFEPIQKHRRCLETGREQEYAVQFRGADFQVRLSPVQASDGKILGVSGIALDVTSTLKLRRASLRYQELANQVIDQNPGGVLGFDPESRITLWNPYMETLSGLAASQVLGRKRTEVIPFLGEIGESDYHRRCLAGETVRVNDRPYRTRDGKSGFFDAVYFPLYGTEMRPIGGVGLIREVSEQHEDREALKRERAALEASEQRYRALFQKSSAAMLQIHPESGKILDANAAAVAFYRSSRPRLLRKTLQGLSADSPEEVGLQLASFSKGYAKSLLARHKLPSGLVKDVELFAGPVAVGGETVLLTIVHDISARRAAQRDLALLKRAIDAAEEAIVLTGRDGTILLGNPAFETLTGYTLAEAVGETHRILKSGKHQAIFYEHMWKTLMAGKVWTGKIINKRKDGSLYHQDTSITPVSDAKGDITHFIAINRDATQEAQLQDRMAVTEKLASAGILAAGVAHEINNPLSVIMGLSQILSEEDDIPENFRGDLRTITDQARRAGSITQGLLSFGRSQPVLKTPLSVRFLLERLMPLIAYDFKKNGIDLSMPSPKEDLRILADADQIQQVLLNLLINAKHAVKSASVKKIQVSTKAAGTALMIGVRDTGCGIDPADLKKIFDPFFTTKPVGQGTGLGLSISYSIAVDHGGTLEVDSEPGKGSEFRLILPLLVDA